MCLKHGNDASIIIIIIWNVWCNITNNDRLCKISFSSHSSSYCNFLQNHSNHSNIASRPEPFLTYSSLYFFFLVFSINNKRSVRTFLAIITTTKKSTCIHLYDNVDTWIFLFHNRRYAKKRIIEGNVVY